MVNRQPLHEFEFNREERDLIDAAFPDFEETIEKSVNEIWNEFDTDGLGYLDRVKM